jgi:hypothetical protein
VKPLRVVLRPESIDGIRGHRSRRWYLGQEPAVRSLEPEGAVGPACDLVALLMHRTVVPATQEREVREHGRAALLPVAEMVSLGETAAAAREAATAIAVVERAPQRRGNRPGAGADLEQPAVLLVAHHHPACVAGQAAGRFRGNVRAVLEDGLPRLLGIGQRRGVDVDHDLVALARGPGIEPVVQGRLGEQGERVRLLLGKGRGFRSGVSEAGDRFVDSRAR